jgi:hypothetical protein
MDYKNELIRTVRALLVGGRRVRIEDVEKTVAARRPDLVKHFAIRGRSEATAIGLALMDSLEPPIELWVNSRRKGLWLRRTESVEEPAPATAEVA